MNEVSKETVDAVVGEVKCSSINPGPWRVKRTVYFSAASDAELRQLLDWPNPRITRPQLLAACHNRWRCGYYIEIEGDWK